MKKTDRAIIDSIWGDIFKIKELLEDQAEDIRVLLEKVQETNPSPRRGKLQAVQIPPEKVEELRREREEEKRRNTTLPG